MTIIQRYIKARKKLFDKYYSHLNEKQREAVYTVNDPLLILAGAGSGKTTVLVKRIVFIMKYGNAYFTDYGFDRESYLRRALSYLDLSRISLKKD